MNLKNPVLLALIGAVLFLAPSAAADTDMAHQGLRGEPFSDPSYQFPMPGEWVNKPIAYEEFAKEADIAVTLEQDVYHLILPLIQKYIKEHGVNIAVQEGTCGISAGALARKAVDIGGFCCPPGKEDRLPGIKFHTLGIVAKAFLVHPDNPVDRVSAKDLEAIFRGKIYRWSELKTPEGKPGPDWKIFSIGRFHCPLRPGHWRLLLQDSELFSPRLHEVGSIPDMISQVETHKDAVGWEVLGMVEKYRKVGKVKPLKINGDSPTDIDALASGKYPFYRTYNITTWEGKGVESREAKKLVDYLMKEVETIDPRFGFAPHRRLRSAGWKFKDNELIGEPK